MPLIPLVAMIRKDLQVYYSDRRAVIMGFIVPIAIASFMGSVFNTNINREPARIAVAIIDDDGSNLSKAIVAAASADRTLRVTSPTLDEARSGVKRGTLSVAVIIPKDFGAQAGRAFFGGGPRPELAMLHDPSRAAELGLVRGTMAGHVMESVSQEMFAGESGRQAVTDSLASLESAPVPEQQRVLLRTLLQSVQRLNEQNAQGGGAPARGAGLSMPYAVKEEAITSDRAEYNFYAHSFAGMSIQFLLFAMIDLGVAVLLERQRGLWKRLRSAPLSRYTLLAGRTVSSATVAMATLFGCFLFAGIVFGVRIHGSVVGFVLVCLGSALMAATFGLLIASLGKTPGSARGIASLATLLMVMLGGAWMPTFLFPAWLQSATFAIPTRWAIDGLDAMTWRGLGLADALQTTAALLGFAVLFGTMAMWRFKWEEA